MSVVIPAENQPFVESLIRSGQFCSESEVVAAALSKMEADQRRVAALRAELLPAAERLDRGEGLEMNDEELEEFFEGVIREGEGELRNGETSS